MPPAIEYPSVSDYVDALQHPRKCFRLPELQASAPELDARRLPCPQTGGAAAVFKLDVAGTPFALKVFKFELPHRQQRYQAISDHLRQVASRYLVGFTYVPDGIRVPRGGETFGQARWYPILRMPWVSGVLLNTWLEEQVTRRNGAAIRRFSERFEAMIAELKSHSIAHGDLQHGNVKVVNGEPVLVDYDGMFVPALAAQSAEEFGLPGYQHPQRKERQWWSAELDDFSAWIIWLSLRALAADLNLWHRLNVAQSETLLFAPEDLERPQDSKLWPDLLRSPDRVVAQRAEMLRTSLSPPFAVPQFTFDRARRLRELCGAAVKDWEGIDREAAELKRAGVAIPPELQHDSDRARQLVEERRKLEDAVRSGDPRRVVAVLRLDLEEHWPACAVLVGQARRAEPQVRALAELDAALTAPVDEGAFAALWKRHAMLLTGVAGAERYEFLAVVVAPPSEQAVVDAWKKLRGAGGHPPIPSPHPRVQLAERRLPLLAAVAAVPRTIGEDADRAFVRAYQPAGLADCAEADELRRWYVQAVERVRSLDRLHGLIAGGRNGLTPDSYFEQVSSAAAELPANYPHARRKETAQALEWLRCRNLLRNACAARQWEEVARLAKSDFAQQPLPDALADEARKAVERVEARDRLDAALTSGSLERAASAYRPDLLDDWPECAGMVAKGRRAKALLPALKQLQAEAANPGDGRRLVQLWQAHAAELTPWKEAPPLRQATESWRVRIEARDAFEQVRNSPRPTAQALAESWQRLRDAGGHPDAVAWQPQGERAAVCVTCMAALRRVPAEPSESADRLFDAAWHQALDGWWEAEGWLPRLSVVRHRLSVLAELEEPLRHGDDLAIVQIAARLPPSYRFDQPARQARVAEARQRADVLLLLLKAYDERRWDDVARLAGSLQGMAWPDDLRAKIEDATARVRARQGLQTALHSDSLEQTVAEYRPDRLDDWPECAGAVERARQATRLLPVLQQLRQEAADPGDGRSLVRTWQAHREELQAWKESAPLGLIVRAWEARLEALAAVERLAAGEVVTAHQFVAAWNRLRDLGGHPDAERWRALAVRMQRRAACFDALRAVPDEASELADRAFAAAWREDELSGWWEAEALRPRLAAVRARLAILAELTTSLQGDDHGVADLAARLPDGYAFGPDLRDAVECSRRRVLLREQMRQALDERPGSDLTIAAVHADFVAAGLSLDGRDADRCELARRHSSALLDLRHLPPSTPIDQRDEAVLRLWQEGGLARCPDVTEQEQRSFEEAALRTARAQQLRDAVELRDPTLVEELANDPLLANYPPVEALRERIGRLLAGRRKVQAVLDCVQRAVSDEEFARLDVDLSCVAEYPAFFRPYRAQLTALLQREMSRAKLRGGQLELSGVGATKVTARWTNCTWRTFGLGEWACKLAVSDASLPDSPDRVSASLVLASGYRAHRGARRDAPPGARRVYVTVWPVLQLDALKVEAAGPPLHLAIDAQTPPRGGWRSLLDSILPRG